tara:strand:- start:390 stop:773 length:384 start_codon:yes stop_codon:yes gene_type:complete
MKYFFFIIIICLISINGNAAWFKLFSISSGDLYLETDSIKRNNNKILFSQLVNYKTKQPNGMLSLKVLSEINCKNLSIRELKYMAFSKKMGLGKMFFQKEGKKSWKTPKKGSSPFFLNEILCDRVSF